MKSWKTFNENLVVDNKDWSEFMDLVSKFNKVGFTNNTFGRNNTIEYNGKPITISEGVYIPRTDAEYIFCTVWLMDNLENGRGASYIYNNCVNYTPYQYTALDARRLFIHFQKNNDSKLFNDLLNRLRDFINNTFIDDSEIKYCIESLKDDFDVTIERIFKGVIICVNIDRLYENSDDIFTTGVINPAELVELFKHILVIEKRLSEKYQVGIDLDKMSKHVSIFIKEKVQNK